MQIKYKAWDKKEERMWLVDSIYLTEGTVDIYIFEENEETGQVARVSNFNFSIKDRLELMQYTGLKDKNTKEIYFDDLVKYTDEFGTRLGKIAFSLKMCAIYIEYADGSATFGGRELFEDCEVIGNIYTDKELMGVKNDKKKSKTRRK